MTLIRGFLDGLLPEPIYSVSEWADAHRYLDSKASAEPGRWRTARTPYLKAIMDALSAHSEYQEVVFMKGAQIGATEAGMNWVGYIMDVAPGPTLMVMPTDDTIKRNSKTRIAPMIEATPRLKDKVAAARSRDASNTTYQKEFPGGVLMMTGANSAAGLRSMPIRYLFLDEVDAYPHDVDGEGSPVDLAIKRTATYSKRKILKVSTPTVKGNSVIEREFEDTDQMFYEVPCPECGHHQVIKFENLQYDIKEPERVTLACEGCGSLIEERYKTEMLERGKWVPRCAEKVSARKVGFHLNSLYSPLGWYSWSDAVRDYLSAENDAPKMKAFVNTVLGETWEEKGDSPEYMAIYDRREDYEINTPPKEVSFITVGVDIQKDRIECEVVGWGRGKQSWSIDYRIFMGDTSTAATYEPLRAMLSEVWKREDGRTLGLSMMAIDSGYNTQHVYDFCQRVASDRVIPVKGQESQTVIVQAPKPVQVARSGKKIGYVKVWHVGVSLLKSELYGWLRMTRDEDDNYPPGYCHFPMYGQDHFKRLTAEELKLRIHRGYKKYEWHVKQGHERNEQLDCRIYARAAATVVGIDRFQEHDYEKVERMVVRAEALPGAAPKPRKKRKRSSWLDE